MGIKATYTKTNRFSIQKIADVGKEQWDSFVRQNSTGYAFHLYDLAIMDINHENESLSFAIYDNCDNTIVFLMPLFLKKEQRNESEFAVELISRRGFVLKDNIPPKTMVYLSNYLIDYFDKFFDDYKIESDFLVEMPALTRFNQQQKRCIINPFIFLGFEPSVRYSWVVDLTKSQERILLDCEETTRQAIRKLLDNEDYYFCETNDENKIDDCSTFIALSYETYKRSSGEQRSPKYYTHLFHDLPITLRRSYFIKESTTNSAIASAIILIYEKTAFYLWNVSKTEKPKGINRLLIYKIMLELKKIGIEQFEIGGAYPYLRTDSKSRGISDFKKCFGADLYAIHRGTFVKKDSHKQKISYR